MMIITIIYTYPAPGIVLSMFSQLFPQQPSEADTHFYPPFTVRKLRLTEFLVLGQCFSHRSVHTE